METTSNMSEAGPSQPLRTTKESHPNLPPGLILGPDGKPCKVCNSWQDWAKMKVKKKDDGEVTTSKGKGKAAGGMGGFAAMMSGSAASPAPAIPMLDDTARSDCPPDTATLGRSTWTFLHTTAAYYPIKASPQHRSNMSSLLSSLSLLYPCSWCAEDFQRDMKNNPPILDGREGLMKWLCERHNEVNDKLGKDKFSCDVKNLDERWKDGPSDGRCD